MLKKYDVSRQTLYNWIKNGFISEPEKDWRGWRIWTDESLNEIEQIIKLKKHKSETIKIQEEKKLYINNRRYLGSKYKLINFIKDIVKEECGKFHVFSDIFGGTGVVGYTFNNKDNKVIMNDILCSNYLAYKTWFSNEEYDKTKMIKLINEFNHLEANEENYVSENFGGKYFTTENAKKIGNIRHEIELLSSSLTFREKAILITSLIYAVDKVANTCGHYDAFRKKIDSLQAVKLQMPAIDDYSNNNNEIYKEDANELVKKISSDITYIDTPYNSRQYSDSYHLLENIAEWKKPQVIGVAKKMIDRSKIKSKYCTVKAPLVFDNLVQNLDTKYILVSYNDMAEKGNGRSNSKISDEEILESLNKRGKIKVFDTDFQYFTTGKTKLVEHKERIFLCKCT